MLSRIGALSGMHRRRERDRQCAGWRACSSTQTHLHFARAARQPKQGHMGSIRTSAEWGRVDGLRARWEVEQGLLEGLAKEASVSVLLPKLLVGMGLRCVASIGLGESGLDGKAMNMVDAGLFLGKNARAKRLSGYL